MTEITVVMRKDYDDYVEFFNKLLSIVKLLKDKGFNFTVVPKHSDYERLPLRFELKDGEVKVVEADIEQIVYYDDPQPFRIEVGIVIYDEKYAGLVNEIISLL